MLEQLCWLRYCHIVPCIWPACPHAMPLFMSLCMIGLYSWHQDTLNRCMICTNGNWSMLHTKTKCRSCFNIQWVQKIVGSVFWKPKGTAELAPMFMLRKILQATNFSSFSMENGLLICTCTIITIIWVQIDAKFKPLPIL